MIYLRSHGRIRSCTNNLWAGTQAVLALASLLHAGPLRGETIVWQESFDDGMAEDRWFAENGVWEIGSPTVGPSPNAAGMRSYSGTTCATTGLNGNYLSGQDSRLVRIASFTVPASNQFPRLRFWHWYSIAGPYCPFNCDEGSYSFVEIKVGTGTWQQVSPTYTSSSSGVWSRPTIDLRRFAGQSVQVAFRFHSATYRDVGWYVDDIALVTGPVNLGTLETFELGLGDWFVESGTWEVGVPASGPATNSAGQRAFAGTNCAATVLGGSYASSVDSRLVSPAFVVPAVTENPRLRFWHWYSIAGPYCPFNCDEGSYAFVELRIGTNAWRQISPYYEGSSAGVWTRPTIDLAPYAGETVQIAFRFHSATYTDAGWYVDEVAVLSGTPLVYTPETFETGLGEWYTESGTWQVGVPTSGPPTNASGSRAFAGTNCAATVLGGVYASYTDSRLVSPWFVVPPKVTGPGLRFRHWYDFAGRYCPFNCDEGSYGHVEVRTGTNEWLAISPTYSGQSGGWTQPFLDLAPFSGSKIQIAFRFHSAANVAQGWFIDDVRLVHDFALALMDSPIVRTQNTACLSLGTAANSAPSMVSFALEAPAGHLSNPILTPGDCWAGTIAAEGDSRWLVVLTNTCSNALMGLRTAGTVCFTAISAHSAFVPVQITTLSVTNRDGARPNTRALHNRTVNIANEPLLESRTAPNGDRILTTYGKANSQYRIEQASALTGSFTTAWSNTVPASLFVVETIRAPWSAAPILFLRATEQ